MKNETKRFQNEKTKLEKLEARRSEMWVRQESARGGLAKYQKRITRTGRRLGKLLGEYLDDELPQDRYRAQKHILEADMERYTSQVKDLENEMQQADKLEEYMRTTTEFVAAAHNMLESVQGTGQKREVIKRLGLNVELSRQGERKCADAVFSLLTIPNAEGHATYSVSQISEN